MIIEVNTNLSSKEKLSILRRRNIDKIIVTHLIINPLRNKFDSFIGQITGNTDILMVWETKLDDSFPIGQFIIEGFDVLYRVDQNANDGGIMLLVREDISLKPVSVKKSPTAAFSVEINL